MSTDVRVSAMQEARAKPSVRKVTLAALSRALSFILRPFAQSESIEAYSNRGFVMLGLALAILYSFFWFAGYLSHPLSRAAPLLRFIYQVAVERTGLTIIPDSIASVAILPIFVYLAVATWKRARLWLGEKFANSFFWLADQAIAGGEWCIENRWQSLLLIVALAVILTIGVNQRFEQASRERLLESDFDDWLTHAEEFVDRSPVAKPERAQYDHVKVFWRDSFDSVYAKQGGYTHPAVHLNQMLNILYSSENSATWGEVLRDNLERLEKCMTDCKEAMRVDKTESEAKAWALMNILMGRVFIRLEEDSGDYRELVKAFKYFSAVDVDRYRPSAINGKGTVYAHAFTAYLSGRAEGEQLRVLGSICPSAYQCAVRALKSYNEAATGAPACSFPAKRRINNVVDLLSRIGMHYDEVVGAGTNPPIEDWVRNPEALAQNIRSNIGQLMSCNGSEPVLSSFFVTTAQGLGASARLKMLYGQDPKPDIWAAGSYLRLANSFEPNSASLWELDYFCPAVSSDDLKAHLFGAIGQSFDGLPSAERLVRRIEQRCR